MLIEEAVFSGIWKHNWGRFILKRGSANYNYLSNGFETLTINPSNRIWLMRHIYKLTLGQ
jgi:hypothetical protein